MRKRVLKAVSWTVGAVTALIVLLIVAGLPLYVFPPAEEVGEADLIYVIGPPREARVAMERSLRAEGVADLSLYSVTTSGDMSADELGVCHKLDVECLHAEPFTTKGEFAMLGEFADEHDVERTIVLTFTPHVARTRYIAEKCFDGDVTVVAVDEQLSLGDWIYQYVYQTAAFLKAWSTPCADDATTLD